MAVDIRVEVDILERSRDEAGVVYDVGFEWVDDTLPAGAINPGEDASVLVETILKKDTNEQIRDKIRDAVILALNTTYGFAANGNLGRGNVRVEGFSNEGRDANASPGVGAGNWYGGKPFRPNIPGKLNGERYTAVQTVSRFDNTLNDDQRDTSMYASVYFFETPNLDKLQYNIVALDEDGDEVWRTFLTQNGSILSTTVDLTNNAQDALWTTGLVRFVLMLRRIVGGRTVNANASGRIGSASISFSRS